MSPTPITVQRLKILPSDRPKLKSINSTFSVGFSVPKSNFFGEFVSNKGVCVRSRVQGPNTMVGLIKNSAVKGRDGDESVRVLEQEAVDNWLSKFRREFMADGLEAALNRLSKWLIAALFGGVIVLRHDTEVLWAVMGSVINSILSIVLKRILNQERPVSTSRSDPGMPSSHAQSIFFIVVFTIVSVMESLGMNVFTVIISGLLLAFGTYLSWLRVSQQFHTSSQVVVGAVLGSIFCILWFCSWDTFVLKAFMSTLWVQIIVALGAAGFSLGFVAYVVRHWLRNED